MRSGLKIPLFATIILLVFLSTAAFAADASATIDAARDASTELTATDAKLPIIWWIAPFASVLALGFAIFFFKSMMKSSEGSDVMKGIAKDVREGAMAYLKQQYKVLAIFFIIVAGLLAYLAFVDGSQHKIVPFAFLTGGFFSALCGYFGMRTATYASARTANACIDKKNGLNAGLKIAFRAGAVMGMVVVGFGLIDISGWFLLLKFGVLGDMHLEEITVVMLCFGMGASSQALFARVGGGIYTKSADVGGDLVGKVEAGIPEDDPRNPATIADNVGDNVGDVAGMGADLYESYCGSILATAALGVAAIAAFFNADIDLPKIGSLAGLELKLAWQTRLLALPMIMAGVGIIISILGIFMVKTKEGATFKQLLRALGMPIWITSVLIAIATVAVTYFLFDGNYMGISMSVIVGLFAGVWIGNRTEYYTSYDFKPTQGISKQTEFGPATVIIDGIATGMWSTIWPVVTIAGAIILAFGFAGGFEHAAIGLYGVGIAAVGMLSTLGYTLATDAYGPIADNAGGNAEMSGLEHTVRERTDALDSLGNTTAATGKGFAIGSAALTAMALIAAYLEEIRIGLIRAGQITIEVAGKEISTATAQISDFMDYYDISIMNPVVLIGLFMGSMLAFAFCAMTMKAVGRAAGKMIAEVRRQFRTIPGIMKYDPGIDTEENRKRRPDYASCVRIATAGAQREMILPSLMAVIVPVLVGVLFGTAAVVGLLAGGLTAGFVLAIFMANAGGAWDNAKKWIEMREKLTAADLWSNEPEAKAKVAKAEKLLGTNFRERFRNSNPERIIDEKNSVKLGEIWNNPELFMKYAEQEWENRPTMICDGKSSDNHKAGVVGDTVGDPFKDTSGPSLNILIKLMSMVSVVFAGLTAKYGDQVREWWQNAFTKQNMWVPIVILVGIVVVGVGFSMLLKKKPADEVESAEA